MHPRKGARIIHATDSKLLKLDGGGEFLLSTTVVIAVKHAIAFYGLACLVVAMAATGGTGFALARPRKGNIIEAKKKRMPLIAANGLLVMIPSALFLYTKAASQEFDSAFYVVQAIELGVGLVQLTLMGRNFRDGLRLTGKWRSGRR